MGFLHGGIWEICRMSMLIMMTITITITLTWLIHAPSNHCNALENKDITPARPGYKMTRFYSAWEK